MPTDPIAPWPLVKRGPNWVRGFQTAVGTASDGIVGPWRALVSGMLSG